jgi:hypothetical protein
VVSNTACWYGVVWLFGTKYPHNILPVLISASGSVNHSQRAAGRITSVDIPNDTVGKQTTTFRIWSSASVVNRRRNLLFFVQPNAHYRVHRPVISLPVIMDICRSYPNNTFLKFHINIIAPSIYISTKCVFALGITAKISGLITLISDVSAHCVCSIFIGVWVSTCLWRWNRHGVPKRRHAWDQRNRLYATVRTQRKLEMKNVPVMVNLHLFTCILHFPYLLIKNSVYLSGTSVSLPFCCISKLLMLLSNLSSPFLTAVAKYTPIAGNTFSVTARSVQSVFGWIH